MAGMTSLMSRFKKNPCVPVIRLDGVIASGRGLGTPSLSDAGLADQIERAFSRKRVVAVALSINSPGGSPVQSSLIAARIRRLAAEKDVPVLAFCEDVAASGGYWLATAGDEIFIDPSSIVGSIGVISASFGLDEFIGRYGIERRVHTAGEDKSMLDPFRPERESDVTRLKALQKVIHDNFIAQVKSARGDKLADQDLFTGEIFVGQQAVDLGLVDGIGHLVPTLKERFGEDVKIIRQAAKRSLASRLGLPGAGSVIQTAEDRAAFARFGV